MTNLLTPQEVLQALFDGKDVEYRFYDEVATDNEWGYFYMGSSPVSWLLDDDHQFRLAQEMLTVDGVSFPKPYQGQMEYGTIYYYPMISYEAMWGVTEWTDCEFDKSILSRNLVHLTKKNAIAHAKALIKLSGGQCE